MKIVKLSLAAAVLVTGLAAQEFKVSGDATFTSNSIWRGMTSTGNTPTVQATVNVEHESGVYAGVWGTGLATGSEIDLFVGYTKDIEGFSVDAGFVDYTTTDTAQEEWNFDGSGELYVGVSKSVIGVDLGATLYQEVLADDKDTVIDMTASKDFEVVYATANVGIHLDDNSATYNYYGLSVGKAIPSIKGDVTLTIANTMSDDDDLVAAVAYTTSF